MKRYLIAGAVGTMVFGAALGSAAALDIKDPGVVQVGESMDLQCDGDGVNIDGYTPDNESMDNGQLTSDRLLVTGIHNDCDGQWLVAVVTDGDGNKISKGVVQIAESTSSTQQWVSYPTVYAKDIEGVRLLIG